MRLWRWKWGNGSGAGVRSRNLNEVNDRDSCRRVCEFNVLMRMADTRFLSGHFFVVSVTNSATKFPFIRLKTLFFSLLFGVSSPLPLSLRTTCHSCSLFTTPPTQPLPPGGERRAPLADKRIGISSPPLRIGILNLPHLKFVVERFSADFRMLRNGITTALKRSTTNHDRFARSRSPALHRSAATLPPPR